MNQEKRTGYLSNIIFMSALCLLAAALVFLMFYFNRRQDARLDEYEARIAMENGEDKLYTSTEVQELVSHALAEGRGAEEADARERIKEILLSGKETSLSTLQTLYPDEIIVEDEFGFYFAPVLTDLAPNEYAYEGATPPQETGVRVSSENGTIRWSVVTDYTFAFVRAGFFDEEKAFVQDPSFYQNVSAALSYGVRVYPYIELPEMLTAAAAVEAADEVLLMAGDYTGEIEETALLLLPEELTRSVRPSLTDAVLSMSETLTEGGFHTIVGGSKKRLFTATDSEKLLAGDVRLDEAYVYETESDARKNYPYAFSFWEIGTLEDAEGIGGTCGLVVTPNE
ncbi:MAG: hypothetical protein J5935_07760 [Lachnospiraceae bacterium]|nr:hypothetical protein [Lachnospiraceae bacterium]